MQSFVSLRDDRKNMTSLHLFNISWESEFVKEAKSLGHSDDFINECMKYALTLKAKNLPVIFDNVHLSKILRINESMFGLKNLDFSYRVYDIKKKHGKGLRQIEAPAHWLREVQRWIYDNILLKDINVSSLAFGFLPKGYNGRDDITIKSNAECHANKKWIINIDLKNFFPSTKQKKVRQYFASLGYVDEVVDALTMLCCFKGRLPQGAPTSPMLSNILVRDIDKKMCELVENNQSAYSRYADDITFSGDSEILDIKEIYKIIKDYGFNPNLSKTKIRFRGRRQIVTGLTITNGVNVPKKYRKEVERELYFCSKFGIESHIQKHRETHDSSQGYYKEWLLGRIMYVRSINKPIGDKMLEKFILLSWL